jgi:hypothetical protein
MPAPTVSEAEFIEIWQRLRSPTEVAKYLKVSIRSVQTRRRYIESRHGITLEVDDTRAQPAVKVTLRPHHRRVDMTVAGGTMVVFSDAHYWPGEPSTAHQAMLKVIKKIKPLVVIANGDIFDGATTSRHEPLGWQNLPTLKQEVDAVQLRMKEIEKAAGKDARLHRTIGNHDLRYERRLATQVPEFKGMPGVTLDDHLPNWTTSWSVMVNDHTMVKHRYHNGVHAAYNNTLKSGTSIVTGHLHRLLVTRWADYTGVRYGVDTGTLAETDGEQFDYAEDNPRPWGSGFAVLTFDDDGVLLPPELCEVIDGAAYFRGSIV